MNLQETSIIRHALAYEATKNARLFDSFDRERFHVPPMSDELFEETQRQGFYDEPFVLVEFYNNCVEYNAFISVNSAIVMVGKAESDCDGNASYNHIGFMSDDKFWSYMDSMPNIYKHLDTLDDHKKSKYWNNFE